MPAPQTLSNLQQELLKLYASNIEDTDLIHIKRYLVKYFADKAIKQADKIWDEKGYSDRTMDEWLNEDDSSYKKDNL
jgi:hypothetical protein